MKTCPYCHKDLPDDSIFCIYCGRPLEKVKLKDLEKTERRLEKEQKQSKNPQLKINPRDNNWAKLGIFFFLVALVGFDCILSTVLNAVKMEYSFAFVISGILYALAILCGIMSFIVDYKDKKKGYEPSGSYGFAIVSIALSFYVMLANLNSGIF